MLDTCAGRYAGESFGHVRQVSVGIRRLAGVHDRSEIAVRPHQQDHQIGLSVASEPRRMIHC
jgi:hypothetical protein